jgi:hypothetical protein
MYAYIAAETANEFATFKCAYAHAGQSFGGIEWFEQAVLNEMLIHANAVVFDFHNGRLVAV